jgi:hypothetical protein
LDANGQPVMQQGSGYLTRQFGPEDLKTSLAPNYEFMLKEGLRAARQRLNAGGSGGSDIDRGISRFAEDYASNAYQNALDNYMKQEAQKFNQQQTGVGNVYNRLAGIAGIGQTATQQTANLGAGTAANIGQLGVGGASAIGAGQIGSANAMAGGLQGVGNAISLAGLIRPNNPSNVSGSNFMQQYNAIG